MKPTKKNRVWKKGVFVSDVHLPDSINLSGLFQYVEDTKPEIVILGGDIVDAEGFHSSESMRADQVELWRFRRDTALAEGFVKGMTRHGCFSVYLEGNHEQRYNRLQVKYPELFKEALNFRGFAKGLVNRYVPYGSSESYHQIGDTVFVHGDIFPDLHAKPYSLRYSPHKVVYGHLHHFQAYTAHRALLHDSTRYAVTAGCLSTLNPEWKRGHANQWVNGFVSFITDGKTTIPTVHLMEKGKFFANGKLY